MTTFVFDGSFEGLLTAIFTYYELKPGAVKIESSVLHQADLLAEPIEIITDESKAARVWSGLKNKISSDWQMRFYKTYLSETAEGFQHLFDFACYIFDNNKGAEVNYGHPAVIGISKLDKSVNRERHRMKAFIRFQETVDGLFYAAIEPDYNVLPLISQFFKNRYVSQRWIIYDVKRKYGLFYNLENVEAIKFDAVPQLLPAEPATAAGLLDTNEALYSLLWNDYFKSTNIPARKNMKLHIQHVPKRYWKYLTEKKP